MAIETLYCVIDGKPEEVEECSVMLAGLLEVDVAAPLHLRAWAKGAGWLHDALERRAVEMTEAVMEVEAAE